MSETDIVMALEWGTDETEICAKYGLAFEKLDKIMEAHDYKKCAKCGAWLHKMEIPDEHCPECRDGEGRR